MKGVSTFAVHVDELTIGMFVQFFHGHDQPLIIPRHQTAEGDEDCCELSKGEFLLAVCPSLACLTIVG